VAPGLEAAGENSSTPGEGASSACAEKSASAPGPASSALESGRGCAMKAGPPCASQPEPGRFYLGLRTRCAILPTTVPPDHLDEVHDRILHAVKLRAAGGRSGRRAGAELRRLADRARSLRWRSLRGARRWASDLLETPREAFPRLPGDPAVPGVSRAPPQLLRTLGSARVGPGNSRSPRGARSAGVGSSASHAGQMISAIRTSTTSVTSTDTTAWADAEDCDDGFVCIATGGETLGGGGCS
jgi:hypothetical protein